MYTYVSANSTNKRTEDIENGDIENDGIVNDELKNELNDKLLSNELIKEGIARNDTIRSEFIKNQLIGNEFANSELADNERLRQSILKSMELLEKHEILMTTADLKAVINKIREDVEILKTKESGIRELEVGELKKIITNLKNEEVKKNKDLVEEALQSLQFPEELLRSFKPLTDPKVLQNDKLLKEALDVYSKNMDIVKSKEFVNTPQAPQTEEEVWRTGDYQPLPPKQDLTEYFYEVKNFETFGDI